VYAQLSIHNEISYLCTVLDYVCKALMKIREKDELWTKINIGFKVFR